MKLVLASASPRRHALLAALGFDFDVVPSEVDEASFAGTRPDTLVRRIARAKAEDVASRLPEATVLAADTIVVLRGEVLNKPRDTDKARDMLDRLRDHSHRVITAVCLKPAARRARIEHVTTHVLMRPYGPQEIAASIARGDPFDKAGAYAIQDPLFAPVASYEGCYCNVVGLPLWTALRMLMQAGVVPVRDGSMPPACNACLTKSIARRSHP